MSSSEKPQGGQPVSWINDSGLDPSEVQWFMKEGGVAGAEKLLTAGRYFDAAGNTRMVNRADSSQDLSSLVSSFNAFIEPKRKQREEYLKAKKEFQGRDATILVPTENPSILG